MSKIKQKLIWKLKISALKIRGSHRTALASFPRSGNTWLRALIEEATGQQSGSIYNDRIMPRKSEGIVIKTHARDSYRYTRAIHVIRNPFDAIESYFRWKSEIDYRDISWVDHLDLSIREWKLHTQHWMNATIPVYRLKYEDLLTDTESEVEKLLVWLGHNPSPVDIKKSIENTSLRKLRNKNKALGDKFFKHGGTGKGISRFDDSQICLVREELSNFLESLEYSFPVKN